MNTFWIIEDAMHEEEFHASFRQTLSDLGVGFKEARVVPFENNDSANKRKLIELFASHKDDFVVPYGSIQFLKWIVGCKEITSQFQNGLGTFFNLKQFSWEVYTSRWGGWMLSSNYVMVPYAELIRRKQWFFDTFGDGSSIFVRPVSNDKVFTGRVFFSDTFDREIKMMGYSVSCDFDPDMMVVVAEPRNVVREWRFAIANREVVTGSLYNENRFQKIVPGCDNPKAQALAERLAVEAWQPEDVYVLDICETKDGDVHLLEIGSINSAGWYGMDTKKIALAIEKYRIKYEQELAAP